MIEYCNIGEWNITDQGFVVHVNLENVEDLNALYPGAELDISIARRYGAKLGGRSRLVGFKRITSTEYILAFELIEEV